MRGVLSGFFILVSISVSFAQDKIHFIDGVVLECWIIEKTPHQVKYHFNVNANSPVITQNASRIQRIVYRNGVEEWVNRDVFRMGRRLAMNFGVMTSVDYDILFTLQADYVITPAINFNARYFALPGEINGFSAGFSHYFGYNSSDMVKLFSGLLIGALDQDFILQLPLGLNYAGRQGLDLKLGVNGFFAPWYYSEGLRPVGEVFVIPEFTIGWRF